MPKKKLQIPADLLESLQDAGIDPIGVLNRAVQMNDAALNARIPSYLLKRIKESAGGNLSARVRELLEWGLDAETQKKQPTR